MQSIQNFVKTTLMGGLFAVLPMVLLSELIVKAFTISRTVTAPITEPISEILGRELRFPVLFSTVLLIVLWFCAGLLIRISLVRAAGQWLERYLLFHMPGYRAIRALSHGLSGTANAGAILPALLTSELGFQEFVYLIEDHGNGKATVMVPSSPTPLVGNIKIVPRACVELLDTRLTEVAKVLSQMGVGSKDLLESARRN